MMIIIQHDYQLSVKEFFDAAIFSVIILIGMGVWVKGSRRLKLRKLLRTAIKTERNESKKLLKAMFHIRHQELVIEFLEKLAPVDDHIAEVEIDLINNFAQQWGLPPTKLTAGKVDGSANIEELRSLIFSYLKTNPTQGQVTHLLDVVWFLINADDDVAEEETLIYQEISGILKEYLSKDSDPVSNFKVLILPQNEEQVTAVPTLLPQVQLQDYRGGKAYLVGVFYSKKYAELVCRQYIKLGLFTVWDSELNLTEDKAN